MQNPGVLAAAQALAAQDMHDCLRRAMWLFRSGLNSKKELDLGAESADSQEKLTLQPLWQATHAAADAWSADYVRRRFA